MDILSELNEQQRAAASHVEGPALVVAGAGSGKTRTLTHRIAYLIHKGYALPRNFLVLTFTNKAAGEIKERVAKLIGASKAKPVSMGTFHSIFSKILRNEIQALPPYTRDYTIYDTDDSKKLLKSIVIETGIETDKKKADAKTRNLFSFISKLKNNRIYPEQITEKLIPNSELREELRYAYQKYQERLKDANAMDFDDLLLNTYQLFRKNPEVLERYQKFYKYILVDEYQDTNAVQYLIIKKLAALHRNLYAVGDDAQSIYGFRGARVENILRLNQDYKDLTIYKLEKNYRSTHPIVSVANNLIKHNKNQLKKTLVSVSGDGPPVEILKTSTDYDEAYKVVDKIREIKQREKFSYQAFAVLYRTNAQSRIFENELRQAKIPYKIVGGLSFYSRQEIKDVLAYLRVIVNPNDEASLFRIINKPTRGIGENTRQKIKFYAWENRTTYWDVIKNAENYFPARTAKSLKNFYRLISGFRSKIGLMTAGKLIEHVVERSGLEQEYKEKLIEDKGLERLENIKELINAAYEFEAESASGNVGLTDFLNNTALMSPTDEDKENEDVVRLMTVHAAKGLEFPVVFVVGAEHGYFPSVYSLKEERAEEEDRRLFYVALTRAKKYLIITFSESRIRYGEAYPTTPSPFLKELGTEHIKASRSVREILGMETELPKTFQTKSPRQRNSFRENDNFVQGSPDEVTIGTMVRHFRFGIGEVKKIQGSGENMRLTVEFRNNGQIREKILVWRYAKLKIRK